MSRSRRSSSLAAALAVALAATAARAGDPPAWRTSALEVPGEITAVEVADLDGDGAKDLLLHETRQGASGPERWLDAFYRRDGRYAARADVEVRVPPDVVLAGAGDVLPPPGDEVLLFTPRAIWRLDLRATSEKARFKKLCDLGSLYFYGERADLPVWDLVGDLDGDGRPEVIAPAGEQALAVLRPVSGTADALVEVERFEAPLAKKKERKKDSDGLERALDRIGTGAERFASGERQGPLYRRRRRAARPFMLETGSGRALVVGDRAYPLDARAEAARKIRMSAYLVMPEAPPDEGELVLADVDGDGVPDLVHADVKLEDQTTRISVRLGKRAGADGSKGGGKLEWAEKETLAIDGVVSDLDLVDVDGDGRKDLVVVSYRLDLIRNLAPGAAPETIDVAYAVFAGVADGGPFARKPLLAGTVPLRLASGIERVTPISLADDLDGDGRVDALVWDSTGRVRALRVEPEAGGLFGDGGGRLALAETPLLELSAPGARDVTAEDLGGKGRAIVVRMKSRLEVHER